MARDRSSGGNKARRREERAPDSIGSYPPLSPGRGVRVSEGDSPRRGEGLLCSRVAPVHVRDPDGIGTAARRAAAGFGVRARTGLTQPGSLGWDTTARANPNRQCQGSNNSSWHLFCPLTPFLPLFCLPFCLSIGVGSEEVVKAHAEAGDRQNNADEDAEADHVPSGL